MIGETHCALVGVGRYALSVGLNVNRLARKYATAHLSYNSHGTLNSVGSPVHQSRRGAREVLTTSILCLSSCFHAVATHPSRALVADAGAAIGDGGIDAPSRL